MWLTTMTSEVYYSLILALIIGGLLIKWLSKPKLNLPPGPVGLPIVGYLPFLGKEPVKTLDNMKRKYGNVIGLYLGGTYVVILGDLQAVEETYTKTTNRPPGIFDFMPDGFGMSCASGEAWVEQRRFTFKSMRDLGLGRSTWINLVEDEVYDFVKLIASKKGNPINIFKLLTSSVYNNIYSMIFGKRIPPGPTQDSFFDSLDKTMQFFSPASIHNYFPGICNALKNLRIGGYHESFREMTVFNSFIKNEADKVRKSDSKGDFFISQYLEVMKENHRTGKSSTFNEKNCIGNAQSLLVGGTDSIRSSLAWLFMVMANMPEIQKKIHSELDSQLDKSQTRGLWEDRLKYPYTFAVIAEGQRFQTIVPLNLSRMVTENIIICGYDIPKGSIVIANFWGLHHDPKYWSEPEEFKPERFLKENELNMKPGSYVPFSIGKRRCPGETVALMEMFIYFTLTMSMFEVKTPHGRKPNMDGILGITYQPVPQDLCFIPRN